MSNNVSYSINIQLLILKRGTQKARRLQDYHKLEHVFVSFYLLLFLNL